MCCYLHIYEDVHDHTLYCNCFHKILEKHSHRYKLTYTYTGYAELLCVKLSVSTHIYINNHISLHIQQIQSRVETYLHAITYILTNTLLCPHMRVITHTRAHEYTTVPTHAYSDTHTNTWLHSHMRIVTHTQTHDHTTGLTHMWILINTPTVILFAFTNTHTYRCTPTHLQRT